MTILQNTLTEPDGTALDGWLDVAVVGNPFRPVTGTEILGPIKDHRFTGGAWSVELTPGLYTVTQRRSDGLFHSRWTADVPDSVSPVWLADCLVTLPGTPTAVPLLGIASAGVVDGRLVLTYTNGQSVDAGPVVGPQGPPYTDSASEFSEAAVLAVEQATEVAPVGAWDYTQAPTVGGVPLGGGGPVDSVADLPAGSLAFVNQNGDGTWPNRPTSRTDIKVFWTKMVAGSADPAAATSPAVTGAYATDIVTGL